MTTYNTISEVYKDVKAETLYIEHVNDVWNIINGDNIIIGSWSDDNITQHKINRTVKKVERAEGVRINLKFRLDDMTTTELKERVNKNWNTIQALEEKEATLVDSYLDSITPSVYGMKREECEQVWKWERGEKAKCKGCHRGASRLATKKEPLLLETKAIIDKLFSMIEEVE